MKTRPSPLSLGCFSPPVMIATFILEIGMACYVLWRYHLNTIGQLILTTLVMLATFQLAEFNVCTGSMLSTEQWSRIGFAAITTLPPLGLHMMYILAGRKLGRWRMAAYASMVGFILFFAFSEAAFAGYACGGNYVIFHLVSGASVAYGFYYYGWLLFAIGLGLGWILADPPLKGTHRSTLSALITGYLVFLVPTAVANTLDPTTLAGIPSIMCGFAVIFAVIVSFYISPRLLRKRH